MKFFKRVEIAGRLVILELMRLFLKPKKIYEKIEPEFIKGRVLFLRPDRLGDVIISTPLFRLIKKRYPFLEIVVVASKRNYPIVKRLPYVDKVILYRKNPFLFLASLVRVFLRGYDFACDLMDIPSVTSAVYLIFSRAKFKLGFSQKPGGYNVNFAYNVTVPLLIKEESHIIERTAQILKPFGIDFSQFELRPDFPLNEQELRYGKVFIDKIKKRYGDSIFIVGVNISAGKETRWWGTENYIELIRNIVSNLYFVVLMCEPKDEGRAQKIRACFGDGVELAPVTKDFSAFVSILKHIDLLVTPDTSLVHISSAFGLPVVGLYPSDYQNLVSWRPYLVPHRVVQAKIKDDLSSIPVDEVLDAFYELVGELKSNGYYGNKCYSNNIQRGK